MLAAVNHVETTTCGVAIRVVQLCSASCRTLTARFAGRLAPGVEVGALHVAQDADAGGGQAVQVGRVEQRWGDVAPERLGVRVWRAECF